MSTPIRRTRWPAAHGWPAATPRWRPISESGHSRPIDTLGTARHVRFTPIGSNVRRRMKHVMRAALKPLLGAMRYFPRARRRGLKVRATSRA
jgi:hypothetical protein